MYTVAVKDRYTRELLDERNFDYGKWAEIGFYLDHYGYNDERYEVVINFSS